jgi:LytR cell envelope-related transcriptional attenuator
VFALAGVGLLVLGLLTLRGRPADEDERPPGAASTTSAPSTDRAGTPTSASPTPGSPTPSPRPTATTRPTTRPPAPPARAPLTVLNNSTRTGLADRAAGQFAAAGWRVNLVGNFSGRIPATTVYFTPGNAAQERAARQLAKEFPAIDRVLPRFSGLPPTPPGLVVVLTRTWPA